MAIKVKNVDPRSEIRRVHIPVVSISSCDTQRIMCPVQGSVDRLTFHTTAAVVAGMHWTISTLGGTSLLDFSKTLTTVASAAIVAYGKDVEFSAGTVLEVNTSSTLNFLPVTVMVTVKTSDRTR